MAKLSDSLRKKIKDLYMQGCGKEDIFNRVLDEALKELKYQDVVWRCIISIISRIASKKYPISEFDVSNYTDTINKLDGLTPKQFEIETSWIAKEILEKNGFTKVVDANGNKDLKFNNPPFDFFGCKDDFPYIIEYKGSKNNFSGIRPDQRQRQLRILDEIDALKSTLIQINFKQEKYRILYDDQIDDCYPAIEIPMDSIKDWIRSKL